MAASLTVRGALPGARSVAQGIVQEQPRRPSLSARPARAGLASAPGELRRQACPALSRRAARERGHGRRRGAARASGEGDVPAFQGFPPMQSKPAWYWRMAAVVPYILPLCEGWLYSDTAMTLFAPLHHYKILCAPVIHVLQYLPSWFLLAYFFTAYLGVVRNNRWPHFLRFHVVSGMLLEITLQVVGTLNDWIPASVIWGQFGATFWLAATIAYIFIVLECIISALKGMYADVPFISDAAYLQIPYE